MTIVLTPYWEDGIQKLEIARQGRYPSCGDFLPLCLSLVAPPKSSRGLMPPALDESIHALRCLEQLRSKDKDIEKYIYLSQLKAADPAMFYRLCLQHMQVSIENKFERPLG